MNDDAREAARFDYFACDFDNNVEFFTTEDAARKFAESALEEAADLSGDSGWPENTTDICYGRVIASVEETKRINRADAVIDEDGIDVEGNEWNSDWSHIAWHELKRHAAATSEAEGRIGELVDVIKQIKNRVCGEAKPNWSSDASTTGSRLWIADRCDEALGRGEGGGE